MLGLGALGTSRIEVGSGLGCESFGARVKVRVSAACCESIKVQG